MDSIPAASELAFVQLAMAFVLCAIACGLILAGRMVVRPGAASESWPAAEGVVIESSVAATRNDGRQRFLPVVRYRYQVGGERFEGSRIQWGASAGHRKYTRARRMLDRYRAGSTIKVHYDPRRPAMAVLQPGHAAVLRPAHVVASMAALYTVFTIGIAIAGH